MTRTSLPRPPRSRRAAAALAFAILALLAATPASPVSAEPAGIAGGSADWGVKASFRSYVIGPIGHGTITPTGGATANPDGTFRFPDATGTQDDDAGTLAVAFSGGARFVAHEGALDLTIDDVRFTKAGTTGSILADVVSRDLDTGLYDTYGDIVLASLDFDGVPGVIAGAETTYTDVPATLSAAGVPAFAGFYVAGTSLDPITFTTSTATGPTTTTTSTTAPSTTTTTPTTTPTTPAPPAPSGPPFGTASATGPEGQTLTASPVYDLNPAGTKVTVSGAGYDRALGVYVAFCVDQGPGIAPSPCLGGADTSGESDSAAWISDNPPPYGEDLAVPFGPGGSFAAELTLSALATGTDGAVLANCLDGVTRCVIVTRADHTHPAERRADVKIPVYFSGQTPMTEGPLVAEPAAEVDAASVAAGLEIGVRGEGFLGGEQVGVTLLPEGRWLSAATADAEGRVATRAAIPADVAPGAHTIELRGLSSGRTAETAAFLISTTFAGPPLPATGSSTTGVAVTGVGLLVAGLVLVLGTRSATRRAALPIRR